jgi:hypothetical protein
MKSPSMKYFRKQKRVPSHNEIYEILARFLSYEILFFFHNFISETKPKNYKKLLNLHYSSCLYFILKYVYIIHEGTFFPHPLNFNTGECKSQI